MVLVHAEHRSPITENHMGSDQAACSSQSPPPGFFIIANISIKIPQQNYGALRWYSLQGPTQDLQESQILWTVFRHINPEHR